MSIEVYRMSTYFLVYFCSCIYSTNSIYCYYKKETGLENEKRIFADVKAKKN